MVAQEADGRLTLKPDYQPMYHLRPYRGGIFSIVELEGFRVEFRRGADGAPSLPDGTTSQAGAGAAIYDVRYAGAALDGKG